MKLDSSAPTLSVLQLADLKATPKATSMLEQQGVTPSQQVSQLSVTPASTATEPVTKGFDSTGIKIFGSTFFTIFLAELGDKTQVATLLMSAESHAPWVVFAGAASALITTSLVGVLVGRWLSSKLAPRTLDISAGIVLLAIAALLTWDVWHG